MPPLSPTEGLTEEQQRYLAFLRVQRRLAERTLILYADALQRLHQLATAEGAAPLSLSTHQARRFLAKLHQQKLGPRSLALILSAWRGWYRWLGQEGLVASNPIVDLHAPKQGKPLPKALGVDDAVRLADHQHDGADPVSEALARCIVELLYGSGLRVSELVGLDVRHHAASAGWVALDAGEAQVLGKGAKRRSVPLGGPSMTA
ncbi:MAG: site-specific integrase, partial [Burkholderiaceae bacterium]